jgi:hypothetical protein
VRVTGTTMRLESCRCGGVGTDDNLASEMFSPVATHRHSCWYKLKSLLFRIGTRPQQIYLFIYLLALAWNPTATGTYEKLDVC